MSNLGSALGITGRTDEVSGLPVAYLEYADPIVGTSQIFFDIVLNEQWPCGTTVTEHPVELGANVSDNVRVELQKCSLKIRATNEPIQQNNYTDVALLPLPLTLEPPETTINPGIPGLIMVTSWLNPAQSSFASIGKSLVGAAAGAALPYPAGPIAAIAADIAASLLIPGEVVSLPVLTDAGQPAIRLPVIVTAQTFQVPNLPGQGQDFVAAFTALLLQLKNAATLFTVYGTKQLCASMVIETLTFTRSSETGTGSDIEIGFKEVRIVTSQVVPAPIPNLPAGGGAPPAIKGAQDPAPPAVPGGSALKALGGKVLGALSGGL